MMNASKFCWLYEKKKEFEIHLSFYIFLLLKLVSDADVVAKFEDDYNKCSIRYGDLKKQLGEDMVRFITPIRDKVDAILADEKRLKEIMEQGAEKANKSAHATMKLVREAMGLKYY